MSKKYPISMVFPAYNEQDNLDRLIRDADRVCQTISDDYEIVIVDDGSVDNTPVILKTLQSEFPNLVVYTHTPNKGYTAALRTGFTNAKKELIFYSDSDNQFILDEISLLLDLIDNNDIVVGYRKDRQDPWIRKFVSRGFNIMSHTIFKFNVRDVDCAFKVFRKPVFEKIIIKSENFMVDAEIMSKAVVFGFRVAETGVTHLARRAGKTTVKPTDVIKTLRGMAKLYKEIQTLKRSL